MECEYAKVFGRIRRTEIFLKEDVSEEVRLQDATKSISVHNNVTKRKRRFEDRSELFGTELLESTKECFLCT